MSRAKVFSPEVVKALLSQHFSDATPKMKMGKPCSTAAAEWLEVFANEAFERSVKLAKADAAAAAAGTAGGMGAGYDDDDDDESRGIMSVGASAGFGPDDRGALLVGGGTQQAPAEIIVTPDHLRRILPALLLDF